LLKNEEAFRERSASLPNPQGLIVLGKDSLYSTCKRNVTRIPLGPINLSDIQDEHQKSEAY
jgi:hypothetical protein